MTSVRVPSFASLNRTCFALLLLTTFTTAAGAEEPKNGKPYALLVGCTTYDHRGITELWGPEHDAAAWAKLLTEQFGFPEANVTRLVGAPKDPAKKPTRANIAKGFEALIGGAGPGDRVFILLSGHGMQVPIPKDQDPLDPRNFEPDGLDEVFLPADARVEGGNLQNHIRDDEIGAWLDKIRAKGADVLIVMDCCHSGTGTRGSPQDVVRNRAVLPRDVGIPDRDIKDATERAAAARARAEQAGRNLEAEVAKVRPSNNPRGSLVAFYAAQPFEEAPELPLPEGAPPARENYYGLLSWTLIQALRESRGKLTYRELEQVMAARYRASCGTRGPFPFAEGDVSREVLGFKEWPALARILLRVAKDEPLKVSAGQLAGLAPGTVLAVYPPPVDAKKRDPKKVLGYVKVGEKPTAYEAEVVPVAFAQLPALKDENLDDLCRCEIAARDSGEMRVKLFLPDNAAVKAAIDGMEQDVREMILPVTSESKAEWALKAVTPEAAAKDYGLKEGLKGDHAILLRVAGHAINPEEEKAVAEVLARTGKAPPRRVFGAYPLADVKALAAALERDVQKVFKWQNVWRVAGGVVGDRAGDSLGVKLELRRLANEQDQKGEILRSGTIPNKGLLGFTVRNEGSHNVWVVALWLDAELGITQYEVTPIESSRAAQLARAEINNGADGVGTEGMVLLVFPQDIQQAKPDFRFLEQSPLRVEEKFQRGDKMRGVPKTPFGQLMAKATLFSGERSPVVAEVTTPAVVVQTWFVTPERK